jgi:hypothetical protein
MAAALICKIQRPLAGNGPKTQCLIYNRSRRYNAFIDISEEKQAELFGDKPKVYAAVDWRGKKIEIGRVVPDEDW